jgi:hypothetical protein
MDEATLGAELDILMARAGVTIPPERRARLLASYADLREQVELLRNGRDAAVEPSNIFHALPLEAGR